MATEQRFCYSTIIGFLADFNHTLRTNLLDKVDDKSDEIFMNYSRLQTELGHCLLVYESSDYPYDNTLLFQVIGNYRRVVTDVIIYCYQNSQEITPMDVKRCFYYECDQMSIHTNSIFDKLEYASPDRNFQTYIVREINENFSRLLSGYVLVGKNGLKIDHVKDQILGFISSCLSIYGFFFMN